MKEITLRYDSWNNENSPRHYNLKPYASVPNLDGEEIIKGIVDLFKTGKKIYVKFADDHSKRPSAIALVKK